MIEVSNRARKKQGDLVFPFGLGAARRVFGSDYHHSSQAQRVIGGLVVSISSMLLAILQSLLVGWIFFLVVH